MGMTFGNMVPTSNIATLQTSCVVALLVELTAGARPGMTATRWFRTAAAIFFVFLWGSAFVPSKIGVLASSPMWFLVVRFGVSGAVALAIAIASGAPWPRGRRAWTLIVLLGILANAMYLGFTYEALRHLAAGVGSVVTSTIQQGV